MNIYFLEVEHFINTYSISDRFDIPITPNSSTEGFKQFIGDNNAEENGIRFPKLMRQIINCYK